MKMFSLRVYELKIMETDLENCFVEQILDAVMKLAPIGFLYILRRYDTIAVHIVLRTCS